MTNINPATGRPLRQRHRETREYASAAVRFNRGLAARVGSGEVADLAEFARVEESLRQAKVQAIAGLRDFGYSWAEIGDAMGMRRQSAQQWFKENSERARCPISGCPNTLKRRGMVSEIICSEHYAEEVAQ